MLSVLLYGSEKWTIKKDSKVKLETFQNGMLKRITGVPVRAHLTSEELRQKCNCPKILGVTAKRRAKYWKRINQRIPGFNR